MTPQEIKKLRDRLGLTQEEFGGRMKVRAITISRWELGRQNPSPSAQKQLERLAR